ncbi:DNA repair protein rhp26 [Coemansia sp. BCRC 34301]|nr:DNA repair protein rhp26 [Coemansia sp. BCRC 34301]
MNLNHDNSASHELQSLSELGVHVVEQLALEQSVRARATQDLNERERETEHKRLVRTEIALDRKLEQLDKANESANKAAPTTARHRNALAKAERLEEEARQLQSECAQIKRRIRDIEARASNDSVEPPVRARQEPNDIDGFAAIETPPAAANTELLAMLVPRRRAAIAAEKRRLGHDNEGGVAVAHDSSSADSDLGPEARVLSTRQRGARSRAGLSRSTKRKLAATVNDSDDSYEEEEGSTAPNQVSDNYDSLDGMDTADEVEALDRQTRLGIRTREADTFDDGNELAYQERLFAWCSARWQARQAVGDTELPPCDAEESAAVEVDGQLVLKAQLAREPFLADPGAPDYRIKAHEQSAPSLSVPRQIWDKLLEYQKAALRWMYTLHQQEAGGILGDEMGLGKTVQVAAFLASMYHSRLLHRPSIIVCPATLMRQWVRELHTWWPTLRVVILHSTGHGIKHGPDECIGGDGTRDLSYSFASDLPSKIETSTRATASNANGSNVGPAAGASEGQLRHDSADEYEYDAYGSRLRRKRQPKGSVNWRKKPSKQKKKQRPLTEATLENLRRAEALVDRVHKHGHIVIATYSGLQVYRDVLLRRKWGYAVLDEGHMVRNPDAEATLACKGLDTRHRILVTGTPIQNNLTELWSLFDYIFPGRLGTLPVFNNQFVVPITTGGYASANSLQVRAGYRCACILRDLIDPYLLRRLKADVAQDLPQKSEHVLFCRLTPMQRDAYVGFLRSNDMSRILSGKLQMLFGVDVARKICDHPDLLLLSTLPGATITHREASGRGARCYSSDPHTDRHCGREAIESGSENDDALSRAVTTDGHLPPDYGEWHKSGKLTIVRALLEMWKPHGHRVLIFSQTRQMLDIIERTVAAMPDMVYRRMDGSTPVQHRSAMVDEYNADTTIFVFLLTTKVGGLGINLTGADRVILYSPDWNPSSDMQARERAWRLGQTRDVAIYRLMTAGTIEEKIYNRQIYKQLLSNKVLSDPNQKRFFHSQSIRDLFSLAGFDQNADAANRAGAGIGSRADGYTAQVVAAERSGGSSTDGSDGDLEQTTETGRLFASARVYPKRVNVTGNGDGVESIGGVVRLEEYRPPTNESDDSGSKAATDNPSDSAVNEDRVLQSLFKMSGVHSALKHDAIVGGKDGESQEIEQEAERIASEARRALRDSQRSRRQLDVNVPTWTGMSGQAGMPSASDHASSSNGGLRAPAVAPPPKAILRSSLPPIETRSSISYAIGKSRRPPTSAASSHPSDSAIYNPAMLARQSAAERRPPSSSVVTSLSLDTRSQHTPGVHFGNHVASGVSRVGDNGLSSTSLLAGLKARSADMQAVSAATESGRRADFRGKSSPISPALRHGQNRPVQRDQIQRLPGAVSQSRGPRVAKSPAGAATRPHGVGTALGKSPGRRASGDLLSPQDSALSQPLSAMDKLVVGQIREILVERGGEVSNAVLVELFRAEFSLSELPRLNELARQVADLESRQTDTSTRQIGIGRIVQKVWRLRRENNTSED